MDKQKLRNILFKNKTTKFAILAIIVIISIFFVYLNGFIPMGLSAKPPVGNIEQIKVEQFIEKNPELSDIPDYSKILVTLVT
jgi:hypothetical protein